MRWRRREGWEWGRGTGPSVLTRLGRQTEVCVWWWGLAAAWLGGREGGRRGGGGGEGSERGWRAGGREQVLSKYRPARRTWHIHTHAPTSVTTSPLWACVCVSVRLGCVCVHIWEWVDVAIEWEGGYFNVRFVCFGWGVFEVLRMAGEQKKKAGVESKN